MSAGYKSLAQLFGGYLHQDYRAEFASFGAAVKAYAKANPGEVASALEELGRLRKAAAGKKLAGQLEKLGLAYDPQADGLTHEELLDRVQQLLEPR